MADFLHTMVRITDPERSRAFYEALGFTFSRDMDIVREGELEATNYFFSSAIRRTSSSSPTTTTVGCRTRTAYGHVAIGSTTSTAHSGH